MLTFVFDMDGTILNSKNQMTKNTIDIFKILKEKNYNIIFASGRMYSSIKYIINNYLTFLTNYSPIISYNGTFVTDHEGNVVLEEGLNKDIAKSCVEFLRQEKVHVQAYINDTLVVENDNEHIKEYSKHASVGYCVVDSLTDCIISSTHPTLKLLAIDSEKKLDIIKEKLNVKFGDTLNIISSFKTYLDIIPINASKGLALKKLSRIYNFNYKNSFIFGDSQNDISMLSLSDNSYVVNNAKDYVKKYAKKIIASNDEEGVYNEIKNIINSVDSKYIIN